MANILVVDDSVTMRQMVAHTLETVGHQTTQAENGQVALSAFDANQFDLVITDINMPVMGGYELIKALRAKPDAKRIPILVLTTEHEASKKSAGREAGATGWIVKPFEPSALIDVLPRVLGQ
jgi:two-component system, chemotaxis family, chemotaxis protein CheY